MWRAGTSPAGTRPGGTWRAGTRPAGKWGAAWPAGTWPGGSGGRERGRGARGSSGIAPAGKKNRSACTLPIHIRSNVVRARRAQRAPTYHCARAASRSPEQHVSLLVVPQQTGNASQSVAQLSLGAPSPAGLRGFGTSSRDCRGNGTSSRDCRGKSDESQGNWTTNPSEEQYDAHAFISDSA